MKAAMQTYLAAVRNGEFVRRSGRVSQFFGLVVESSGPDAFLGEVCEIHSRSLGTPIMAEVVGLKDGKVLLMPYGELRGIAVGCEVMATGRSVDIGIGPQLLGRVIDAFGRPLDGRPLAPAQENHRLIKDPLDSMLTIGRGQRVGIFSGSGVGKSTLLGMIARNMKADINVIALIGERGREVLEFIDQSLGPEGLARSVVVVATSDQPALVRVRAAHAATAIAEYFRDRGRDVLLTMDSITRFAMAQREIGLSIGEPPTSRGYTPSVFAVLPKLLERCGTGAGAGSITAIYSVLVEGDDLNDPIADSLRALLDGHFVLSRELANQGHYPAIDVLASNSRLLVHLVAPDERALVKKAIALLSDYHRNKDMIDVGAYRSGMNPELDRAVRVMPDLQRLLRQDTHETFTREQAMQVLRSALKSEALA